MQSAEYLNRGAALAAIFQAANLVDRLATHGLIPSTSYEILAESLFRFDAESVADIYASRVSNTTVSETLDEKNLQKSLSIGIRVAKQVFTENASQEYPHTIRYVMSLIKLTKQFSRNTNMQLQMHDRLEEISLARKQENNHLTEQQIAEKISKLYLDTVATLPFRIQVLGKMQHLQNSENEQRIRVLLLAGIRASLLWKQLGGRAWHFIFHKGKIAQALEQIANN